MNYMSGEDECTVSAIVTGWKFVKRNKDELKLSLDLQMFDGTCRYLDLDLDFIPSLFEWFSSPNHYSPGRNLDFVHSRVQCLVVHKFKETPLGLMKVPYDIRAIRNTVHQDWLYVQ